MELRRGLAFAGAFAFAFLVEFVASGFVTDADFLGAEAFLLGDGAFFNLEAGVVDRDQIPAVFADDGAGRVRVGPVGDVVVVPVVDAVDLGQ